MIWKSIYYNTYQNSLKLFFVDLVIRKGLINMALIKDVFNETYPQLAEQLDELGITDTDELEERFKTNGSYLVDTLDYDLKDNEKIRSTNQKVVEKEFDEFSSKSAKQMILMLIIGFIWVFALGLFFGGYF